MPRHPEKTTGQIEETEHSPDRRAFVRNFAIGALVLAMRGDLGCKALDLLNEGFTPEETQRIQEVLLKVRDEFPSEKFGHFNVPFYFDKEGELYMKLADTPAGEGWDCFDISVNLARELQAAGFKAGVVQGSDRLRIWGTHCRAYVEKNGNTFELDLTPPYHNASKNFPDSNLGHANMESILIDEVKINTHGRAFNADKKVRGGAGYSAGYLEIENEKGKLGFLFSVCLLQAEEALGNEAFGMVINRQNGPMKITVLIDGISISDGYFGTDFQNTLKLALELDPDGKGLSPVHNGMTIPIFDGYREVYFKALQIAINVRKKLDVIAPPY